MTIITTMMIMIVISKTCGWDGNDECGAKKCQKLGLSCQSNQCRFDRVLDLIKLCQKWTKLGHKTSNVNIDIFSPASSYTQSELIRIGSNRGYWSGNGDGEMAWKRRSKPPPRLLMNSDRVQLESQQITYHSIQHGEPRGLVDWDWWGSAVQGSHAPAVDVVLVATPHPLFPMPCRAIHWITLTWIPLHVFGKCWWVVVGVVGGGGVGDLCEF